MAGQRGMTPTWYRALDWAIDHAPPAVCYGIAAFLWTVETEFSWPGLLVFMGIVFSIAFATRWQSAAERWNHR